MIKGDQGDQGHKAMKTKKYIRTQFGLHDYKTASKMFTAVISQSATASEVSTLWEILRVVFGETTSRPPAPTAADPNRPDITVEYPLDGV